MHVAQYLEFKNLSQQDFSRLCGVSVSSVSFWQSGKGIPCKSHMEIITKVTGGLVTMKDIEAFVEAKSHETVSVAAAAKMLRMQAPSVLKCIRDGKLQAAKINKKWHIPVEAIELYKKSKYDPEARIVNGQQIWNVSQGRLSPQHVAKMMGVTLQTIYLMIKNGVIESNMVGGYHVIQASEVERLKNNVEELRPLF